MARGIRRALLVVGMSGLPAHADPAPPFRELLEQSRTVAPALIESRAAVAFAEAQVRQARALPNPTVGIEYENFGGQPSTPARISPEQSTVTISQPIEWFGKRSSRIDASIADASVQQLKNQHNFARFGHALALAYAAAEAGEARVRLLEDSATAAVEDRRGAQALVDAGREAGVRTKQATAALLAAQADLEGSRAEESEALARLTVLVAAPQEFTGVVPSLLRMAETPFVASAPPRVFATVAIAQAEREAALRKVQLERARAVPDLSATLGIRRLMGDRDTAFIGGVSLPFPLFDRNGGNIAAAGADVAAAEARLAAARAEAETGWRAGIAQASAAAARVSAALSAVAAADEAYALTRTAYAAGKISLIDLLSARRAARDSKLLLLDAQLSRVRTEAALALLAGRVPFGDDP
jgi:cobalt-zinc-cadmium efflux system outer membrane protein